MSNTQMGGPSFSRRLKLLGQELLGQELLAQELLGQVLASGACTSISSWGKFKCKLLGIGLRQRD